MTHTAVAKVFTSGNSQAIRLPKEFRLDATEVIIVRAGDSIIVTPRMTSWTGFAEGLSGFSSDFTVAGGVADDAPRDALA
jgi:antitoxin VapB